MSEQHQHNGQAVAAPSASPMTFSPVAPAASRPLVAHPHHAHDHDDGIMCACGHDHGGEGHSHSGVKLDVQLIFILPITIAALILAYAIQWTVGENSLAIALGLLATALAGGPIIWSAIKGLSKGRTNVNELVSLAIIGALWLGMPLEAGLVALILQIAALIESVATDSAQKAVMALQKLAPKHARIKHNGHDHVVEVEKLKLGDILVVGPGERVAADGTIVSGMTSIDEASVTGESVPVDKTVGGEALAGTINLTGSIEVKVQRVGEHSALGQTIALVRRAQQFQPQIIRAADKFFAFYTPIILGLSVLVLIATGQAERMVAMWVVGCPCAMLLASPMAIVVALSRASRSGIQVKAGPFVEASATLQTVVFDKTGTLTTGNFIVPANGVRTVPGVAPADLLKLAATIESRSTHPLARAIVDYAKTQSIVPSEPADMKVLEGLGIEATVDQHVARAGSFKILDEAQRAAAAQLDIADESLAVVPVYVTHKGKLLGAIYLTDEIRPEAARTISRLRQLGIKKIAMLTGDRRQTAELVGRAVGVDEVFSELLPGQKVDIVRQLQRGGKGVAVVGDGINDSPALAAATLGVAMGVRGTDVAIQAAHAVLLKDDLTRVPLLIYLAQQTRWAIYQNLGFACVFAGLAEAAAAAGWLNPVMAALVHVLAVVVIAINSIRLAGTGSRKRHPARTAVEPTEAIETPRQAMEPALQPA